MHFTPRNAAASGQAALSLVFLIGGIVVLVGVTLSFLAITFINSSTGFQNANRALFAASAGVHDALLQLSRNRDFSSAGYTVSVGSYNATVTVTQNSPATDQATIVSVATVSVHTRRVQAITSVNDDGRVDLVSWNLVL